LLQKNVLVIFAFAILLVIFVTINLTATADNETLDKIKSEKNIAEIENNNKTPDNKTSGDNPNKTGDNFKLKSEVKKQPILVEIRELIQKLGDDSFVVRERASKRLLQIGVIAEPELRRATNNDDSEISRRAELLLSQLDQTLPDSTSEDVEVFLNIYTTETNPAIKLACIAQLGNPLPGACEDGEGLMALCRIVRFDKDKMMRNEAVKSLIAFEPFTLSKKEKWYQNMRRVFMRCGDDLVFILLRDYSALKIDLIELRKRTEAELENKSAKSGETVEYPVKLPEADSKKLKERLKKFAGNLDKFQKDPLYSKIKPGHWVDILVNYSLAEMYDALGMNQERDKILEKVLTIREEQPKNQPMIIIENENKTMNEHSRTALILYYKQRLTWAERHLKLVIDNGDVFLKVSACTETAMIKFLKYDLQGAIEYFEKCNEIIKSDDYKKFYGDTDERLQKNNIQILAYQAQLAAENNDWDKAKELVDNTLAKKPDEIDTIILRYKICERNPTDLAYKAAMQSMIENATSSIRREMGNNNDNTTKHYVACNQVAWLLANTNGEFSLAKDLIDITMRYEPDSPTYLDTQACVYALGKQYDKAIKIQTKTVKLSPESKLYKNALEKYKKLKNESK
jgi:tetratricopeptide (TPR) repeat protein